MWDFNILQFTLSSVLTLYNLVLFPRFRICSNDQFSGEELKLAEDFKKKFRSTAMTIVSFYEVDFTSDKTFLLQVGANVISGLWDPTLNSRLTSFSDHVGTPSVFFRGSASFLRFSTNWSNAIWLTKVAKESITSFHRLEWSICVHWCRTVGVKSPFPLHCHAALKSTA